MLIGNLTRDPELRYTPGGTAVCNFGLATNRRWTTSDGEQKEAAQFHRIVAWAQLAELCAQLLSKGDKVFVSGRIQYRKWEDSDEIQRESAEVVINDMILLRSLKPKGQSSDTGSDVEEEFERSQETKEGEEEKGEKKQQETDDEEVPF
jgi:single-strand DNA-binding protein